VSGIVADTSEWIEYLAGRPAASLDRALETGSVVVPPIVVSELLGGARTREEFIVLEDLVRDLELHPCTYAHWIAVGELRRSMRAAGVSVSAADAHVAQCALDRGAPLLSRDAIFLRMAEQTPLRLISEG
jgi:tRNA(fMet)-specific endonuclease VapC